MFTDMTKSTRIDSVLRSNNNNSQFQPRRILQRHTTISSSLESNKLVYNRNGASNSSKLVEADFMIQCDEDQDEKSSSLARIKFERQKANNKISTNKDQIKRSNSMHRVNSFSNHQTENNKTTSHRSQESSALKRIQRNQIYALNELMTHLEYEDFVLFCKENNIQIK